MAYFGIVAGTMSRNCIIEPILSDEDFQEAILFLKVGYVWNAAIVREITRDERTVVQSKMDEYANHWTTKHGGFTLSLRKWLKQQQENRALRAQIKELGAMITACGEKKEEARKKAAETRAKNKAKKQAQKTAETQ